MIEEISEAEARDADRDERLRRAVGHPGRAAVSCGRRARGHILQVSSIGGISAFPNIGIYNASKWALEGAQPDAGPGGRRFGIKVTLIEPGGYSTDWGGSSARHADAAARLRRVPRAGGRGAQGPASAPRATRRRPASGAEGGRRRASRRCGSSSATGRWGPPQGLRVAACEVAGVGAGVDRGAREEGLTEYGLQPPARSARSDRSAVPWQVRQPDGCRSADAAATLGP